MSVSDSIHIVSALRRFLSVKSETRYCEKHDQEAIFDVVNSDIEDIFS
jgi:hypothetical protein